MRVGIFGGSFNPPHVGHVLSVAYALSVFELDRVLVIPVFHHSLGKALAPFEDRLELCRLAFDGLSHAEVCPIERELGAPSRTLATLQALATQHPSWRLRLIVGSDILSEVDQWHAFDKIQEIAPLCVLPRTGAGESRPAPGQPPPRSSEELAATGDRRTGEGEAAAVSVAAGVAPGGPPVLPEVSSTQVRQLLEQVAVSAELNQPDPQQPAAIGPQLGSTPATGVAPSPPRRAAAFQQLSRLVPRRVLTAALSMPHYR